MNYYDLQVGKVYLCNVPMFGMNSAVILDKNYCKVLNVDICIKDPTLVFYVGSRKLASKNISESAKNLFYYLFLLKEQLVVLSDRGVERYIDFP